MCCGGEQSQVTIDGSSHGMFVLWHETDATEDRNWHYVRREE